MNNQIQQSLATSKIRIGNWFKDGNATNASHVQIVANEKEVTIWNEFEKRRSFRFEEDLFPIELNVDILRKCGFIQIADTFEIHGLKFIFEDNRLRLFGEAVPGKASIFTHSYVHYLHQLQNLVFKLSEKELDYAY